MVKVIARSCYWVGLICAVLSLISRALNAAGWDTNFQTRGSSIGYHAFLDGALLFFFATMATAGYDYVMSNKP